jgi:uncharacterized membrane protein
MSSLPVIITSAAEAWSSAYSAHASLRVGVTFGHLAGLMAGGGLAVAADRDTLRLAGRSEADRVAHLDELHAIHRVVIAGLVLTFATGLLMLAADLEAIGGSAIFWAKMTLVGLLVANGRSMQRAERAAMTSPARAWPRLHRAATVSLILWFLIIFAGTLLTFG